MDLPEASIGSFMAAAVATMGVGAFVGIRRQAKSVAKEAARSQRVPSARAAAPRAAAPTVAAAPRTTAAAPPAGWQPVARPHTPAQPKGDVEPNMLAARALGYATLGCAVSSGVAVAGVYYAYGVSSAEELAVKLKKDAPEYVARLEAALGIERTVPGTLADDTAATAGMSYDEEVDYWAQKMGPLPGIDAPEPGR